MIIAKRARGEHVAASAQPRPPRKHLEFIMPIQSARDVATGPLLSAARRSACPQADVGAMAPAAPRPDGRPFDPRASGSRRRAALIDCARLRASRPSSSRRADPGAIGTTAHGHLGPRSPRSSAAAQRALQIDEINGEIGTIEKSTPRPREPRLYGKEVSNKAETSDKKAESFFEDVAPVAVPAELHRRGGGGGENFRRLQASGGPRPTTFFDRAPADEGQLPHFS